jgi:hypothetical protein
VLRHRAQASRSGSARTVPEFPSKSPQDQESLEGILEQSGHQRLLLLLYGRRHVERLSPHPFQPSRAPITYPAKYVFVRSIGASGVIYLTS